MAPSRNEFIFRVHELDGSVRKGLAEFVAGHFGADQVADFAAGCEIGH